MSPPRYVTWKMRSSGRSALSRQRTQPTPERSQSEFVARRADRLDPGDSEVPDHVRRTERRQKGAAGPVHVDVDVEAGVPGQLVEGLGELEHRLVGAGVGHPEGGHHHDGVLVDLGEHLLDVHAVLPRRHGDLPHLDVPVLGELVPHHLDRTAHHVGPVGRLALGLALGPPPPLGGHTAEHAGLRGSDGRAPDGLAPLRSVPQVRRASGRSGARSRPSGGTRPCRSCSCSWTGPSTCGPRPPPRSDRRWPDSGGRCRPTAVRRRCTGRHPRAASPRSGSGWRAAG